MKIRTNKSFGKLSDTELSRFAGKIIAGLTGNAVYPSPPVEVQTLATLKQNFDDALIVATKGTPLATARKNTARAALLDGLDKDAAYVDITCDGDLDVLLTSNYEAVSTNRSQRVLNPPQIVAVSPAPQSGQLSVRVNADPNSKSFVGRIKLASGSEFGPSISFKNSRSIIFDGLVAGASYVLQLMAVGGKTGQSDWSDPATGMPR